MTHLFNRSFATLSIALAITVAGCASAPATSERPESQAADSTGNSDWLQDLPTTLSSDLCAEHEVFRTCFPVSEDECHQRTQAIAATCEIQYRPANVTTENEAQGAELGGSIGACTGTKLYETLDASYPLNETENCKKILDET